MWVTFSGQRRFIPLLDADTGASGGDDADRDNQTDQNKDKGSDKDNKTFTQEDIDRIVSQTIARERTKWETDFETKLAAAKTEAEKLAKMNADQKAEYERQQRETKLAEREAEITRRELRASALETLAEKGLPMQLADVLIFTDADSTKTSLEAVETSFRTAVEAGVNERLKGNPPKGGGGGRTGEENPWSKDTFNLTKQGQILQENPELAARLKASAKK